MLKLYDNGIYLVNGETICSCPEEVAQKTGRTVDAKEAEKGTMAYGILQAHNKSGDPDQLQLKFDSMTSHDITYVGIIQTARASGMKQFPLPYVLTNCHNSLCAVGGTINADDHKLPRLRLPHPLRCIGHHGGRRGRRRAGQAASGPHL